MGVPTILVLDADREWSARADRAFGVLRIVVGDFDGDAIGDLAFHFVVFDERGCDPDDPF